MSRSHRLYRGALAGGLAALLAASAQSQELDQATLKSEPETTPQQEEGHAEGQRGSSADHDSPFDLMAALKGIEAAIRALETKEDEPEAERREYREIADLEAQQDMAFWAKLMFFATSATVLLTVVALFLIFRTLHHTRRAADYAGRMSDEARRTTEAANISIEAARISAERQLRAYLTVEARGVMCQPNVPLAARVSVKNVGQTPAYTVQHGTGIKIVESEPVSDITSSAKRTRPGDMAVVPQQIRSVGTSTTWNLSKEDYDLILRGEKAIMVFGYLNYVDIFGVNRVSRFCHLYSRGNFNEGEQRYADYGNSAE